jgi:hypothetical protein
MQRKGGTVREVSLESIEKACVKWDGLF